MASNFQAEIVNRILSVAASQQWSMGNWKRAGTDATNMFPCVDPFATWEVHKNELLSSYRRAKDTVGSTGDAPWSEEGGGWSGAMLWKVT